MTTLTVYDPAMCCSTGLCGTDVDQRLIDLAADLEWLAANGVTVRRFGLSRDPAEFIANETIRQILQESGGDDLPAFILDGRLMCKAHYPSRSELAGWTGVAAPAKASTSCCGGAAERAAPAAASSGCCGGSSASVTEQRIPAVAAPSASSGCCGGGASGTARDREQSGRCC